VVHLIKFSYVQKFPRASLLACARSKSVRREIRVPFAATRRRVIRRGEHVQRNGSQILCAFVVSGVQRRDDRSWEICTHGCCAFARVASMNRPRIPRARWYVALLRCCLISGVHCVQISPLNPFNAACLDLTSRPLRAIYMIKRDTMPNSSLITARSSPLTKYFWSCILTLYYYCVVSIILNNNNKLVQLYAYDVAFDNNKKL